MREQLVLFRQRTLPSHTNIDTIKLPHDCFLNRLATLGKACRRSAIQAIHEIHSRWESFHAGTARVGIICVLSCNGAHAMYHKGVTSSDSGRMKSLGTCAASVKHTNVEAAWIVATDSRLLARGPEHTVLTRVFHHLGLRATAAIQD